MGRSSSFMTAVLLNGGAAVFAVEPAVPVGVTRELMPAPGSRALPHVYLRKTPDGGSVISSEGTHDARAPAEAFQIEVDETRGTYTLTPVPTRPPGRLLPGGSVEHEEGGVPPFAPPPSPSRLHSLLNGLIVPDEAFADWTVPGEWWGQVGIVGIDPIKIWVCALQQQVGWWSAWPNQKDLEWYWDHLEAVHPTAARTNWWLESYANDGVWWGWVTPGEGWQPCHSNAAQFYNVDFPPTNPVRAYGNRTTLWFSTQTCVRDEYWHDWWWWWYRGGPYSSLLNALVFVQ